MAILMPRKLWEPAHPERTSLFKFMQLIRSKYKLDLHDYQSLYQWSIDNPIAFWEEHWKFCPLISSGQYQRVVDPKARMDSVPRWFEGVRINFAENLLYSPSVEDPSQRCKTGKEDDKIACTGVREGGTSRTTITWAEFRKRVGELSNAMRAAGVLTGDRIGLVASNSIDTMVVFLATTTLGAIFSSSSTDMGTKGILDRLTQIQPRFVFFDDAAFYNGKRIDLRSKMIDVVHGLDSVPQFQKLVSLPRWDQPLDVSDIPRTVSLSAFLASAQGDTTLAFERVEFGDPFLIVYSSGTTGQPKCIMHGVGTALINAKKEVVLHRDVDSDATYLQYTTTGWIMYLAQSYYLLAGVHLVLYDGSPFQPDIQSYIRLMSSLKVTQLGTSPKWLSEVQKAGIVPQRVADITSLKTVTCTGMVLPDSLFAWFYDAAFPRHVHLGNMIGGTDIAGAFALENSISPVYMGGCQGRSLGIKVEVFDSLIEGGKGVRGRAIKDGEPGELVATAPFPNQPVAFWPNDTQARQKYFNSYYARFDNVWTHGDFIMINPQTDGVVVLGRADGVLNPSGVRFGSSEIYSVIEMHFPEIQDSICVGQRRPQDPDERVLLFVLMQPGSRFGPRLIQRIKDAIAQALSKRHVPAYIFETPAIPTTVNLKKVELPVKHIVSGKTVQPSDTLANKESLDYYYQFARLEELDARQHKSSPKL